MSIPALQIPVDLDLESLRQQGAAAAGFVDSTLQQISSSFADANNQMTGIANQSQSVFAGMGSSVTVATLGITGAALGAQKLLEAFANINAEVGAIARQAQYLNTTTGNFQVLRFAFSDNGVGAGEASKDLENIGRLLNDAQRNENSLTKLLDANNIAYKDQAGHLITINDLLQKAGQLIQNAGSFADKVEIAKMLGLSQQAIPALEEIATKGFGGIADAAQKAGVIIDEDTIAKAEKFSEAWKQSSAIMAAQFQAAFFDIANDIDGLIAKLGELLNMAADAKGIADAGATQDKANRYFDYLFGGGGSSGAAPVRINIPLPPRAPGGERDPMRGPSTVIPAKDTGDDSNGFDRAEDQIKKRTEQYKAEAAAVGLDTEAKTRLKAIATLNAAADAAGITLTEKQRQEILQLAQAEGQAAQAAADSAQKFKQQNDLVKFGGDQMISVMDGLRTGTLNAQQAVNQLANAFITAAEKALLLGEGPLAGLFGTAAAAGSGGTGGLLGALVHLTGRADGGPIGLFRGAGTGRSDSNVIQVSDGEYIVNAAASSRNRALLDAINFGGAFAAGGPVGSPVALPSLETRGGSAPVFAPVYQIDARGSQMTEAQFVKLLATNNQRQRQQWQTDFGSRLDRMNRFGH